MLTLDAIVGNTDPLKKREDFAISLRKKKSLQIIQSRRERTLRKARTQGFFSDLSTYTQYEKFEQD